MIVLCFRPDDAFNPIKWSLVGRADGPSYRQSKTREFDQGTGRQLDADAHVFLLA